MNARLNYKIDFLSGVHYQNVLRMNHYHLSIWMTTQSEDSENHNIAFERLKAFVSYSLDSAVFINRADQDSCEKLLQAGVNICTLPEDPVDQVVGIMLFSKLNAIMEGRIIIDEIEISSDLGDNMIYLHGASENIGPFEQKGWWHEPDLSFNHSDLVDENKKIMNINRAIGWRDLDLQWPGDDKIKQEGNTIVYADFGRNENK